jgi:hypothetical protein
MSRIEADILNFIETKPQSSSAQIAIQFANEISLATIKRMLKKFVNQGQVLKSGAGKNTRYKISGTFKILSRVDIDLYFKKDIDERKIQTSFNFNLIHEILATINLFTNEETGLLNNHHQQFKKREAVLTPQEWSNEMERLAIDLSWKSSQIEGNTYSLLETEQLLKEKKLLLVKQKMKPLCC